MKEVNVSPRRRQTSAYKKGEGRKRRVESRFVLAEVTAHWLSGAMYGAEEQQIRESHLGFCCRAWDNLK